ncbi:MAG: DUF554 family protein [Verrucomicrobia bacterium]|nr:MAG: DUF554 family protein [Verrucomicrobiota bacterium]
MALDSAVLLADNGAVTGIALYLACTVAAAVAVASGMPVPGADAQRRVRGLLGLGSVYLAVAIALGGWTTTGRPWWQCLALVAAGLVLGNAVGLLVRFQRCSNRVGRWAGGLLGPAVPAARFGGGLALVLGLNPLGWIAGLLAGMTGDWRLLVFKGALDSLGVWTTGAGRPASAALGAAMVALGQAGCVGIGGMLRVSLEGTDAIAMFGIAAGVYLALLPLVLFGIARVPWANLFLSLPTVLVLARFWH